MTSVPGDGSEQDTVVLHSSWSGIILAALGAALFVAVAIAVLIANGPSVGAIIVLIVAVALAVVVLFDLPIATTFTRSGVIRRTPLRHHELAWSEIARLKRLRTGVVRTQQRVVSGGLVANRGRRNYTLVDSIESAVEYDDLRRLLGEQAERLGLTEAIRPPDGTSPTWLYRRARWRPPDAT